MKFKLGLLMLLAASLQVKAQLDNRKFEQRSEVVPADSNSLFLGLNSLGFTKNNEYFNDIADGYTLFGYQLNPYLSYNPAPNFKITAGVYLQKDFGRDDYNEIAPVFSLEYVHGDTKVIFGNLEGSVSHRLIEPLYDFEKVLVDRLENGFQLIVDKDNLFVDGWVNWQNMIYKGDFDQEEITGGLSFDYKVLQTDQLSLSVPLQFLVMHRGGQIDSSPAPLQTYTNTAVGFTLEYVNQQGSFVKSIHTDNYYVNHKDFSTERLQVFEDGSGWYLNAGVKTRAKVDFLASYWRGHEFISIAGGQLYPSVSSTFKSPGTVEEVRELLIFRVTHNLKVTDQIWLTTRFEPFYDLGNGNFEFSHGFYINYSTDFLLLKKRSHR
ncbi:hypothetical protein JMN32_04040 [Fulvivirga sp. 29W222]|uniref:Uncharacterized protein n=1 Tax=Fulvivirga marina TaxID=2494733 RepID=A0A937FVW7_9BACT|nr:hypothetical protein [Fulvivirga marina]MBL6445463.1 hypothetical protein [Fulvivirga marina]